VGSEGSEPVRCCSGPRSLIGPPRRSLRSLCRRGHCHAVNRGHTVEVERISHVWISLPVMCAVAAALAGPPEALSTLVAPDAAGGEEGGRSVAAAGRWVVIGMPGANIDGVVNRGAAWVFRAESDDGGAWIPEQRLLAPDGAAEDDFGLSVAIDDPSVRGDAGEPVAIVGALHDDVAGRVDAGSASVFRRIDGTWVFEQTLLASGGLAGDEFGRSVAIRGDVAVVGAWDDGLFDRGAVYVFVRDASGVWQQAQKLTAPGAGTGDHLGTSVALDAFGARLVAGAWGDDAGASNGGSASVWRRAKNGAFVFEQELVGSALDPGDELGRGVAIDGDLAVLGGWAFWGDGRGTARVFRRSGTLWSEEAALDAPDGSADDYFGFSVACRRGDALDGDGDLIACGAWADDVLGTTNQGSVWVFERTAAKSGGVWSPTAQLIAEDGGASDYFGFSLAFDCDRILVGVRFDDVEGVVNAGSARVWWIDDADGNGVADGCGSGGGLPGDLDGDGVVGPADLALLLSGWGGSGAGDLDGDGTVGPGDLTSLLAAWDAARS
jgi:hypothetical protein